MSLLIFAEAVCTISYVILILRSAFYSRNFEKTKKQNNFQPLNLHNNMSDMQKDMKEMQTVQKEHGQKFESIELRMDKMETKNELRHEEVLSQIKRVEKDHDFIWGKAVRNERT